METAAPTIRIGILVARIDGFENWQLMIFDRIVADPRFSLVTFLIHPHPFGSRRASPLFGFASRLEQAVLARQPAYIPRHFDPGSQRFELLTPAGGYRSAGAGIEGTPLTELDLDLVIRLTPESLPGDVIGSLPFGEWALTCCDQLSKSADWFGYASVIGNAPATELQLYVRSATGKPPACIASSAFNIKFSAARNAAFIKERAVTLLMRELGRLAGTGRLETAPLRQETGSPPSPGDLLRYGGFLSGHLAARAKKALKARAGSGSAVWTLFTGRGCIDDFEPGQSVEIPPATGDIKADPFLLQVDGDCYLFYEAYADGARKAHIAVGRFDGDTVQPLGVALDCAYHLSYPFVFREGGDIFMMPETHQSRRIEIWRCVEFPLRWEPYSTALTGHSPADSVLTRHDGKWWLFTNLSDYHAYEDHCSELYVFEVDGPALTRLVPHKHNPVVIGSAVARNAGRIFERDGRLYRPSQRNAHGIYGYGLNIMEIEQLDLETYRERCIRTIAPDFKPGLLGCHHFDAAGDRYVVDARVSL